MIVRASDGLREMNEIKRDIVKLLQKIPEQCFGASEEQIRAGEQYLHTTLPTSLKDWWRLCNGLMIAGGVYGIEVDNPYLDIKEILNIVPHWLERRWFPIAGDECGNYYVLIEQKSTESAPVCFVDNGRNVDALDYIVGSDLDHFMLMFLKREVDQEEGWPFDEEWVLRHDPKIVNITVAPLPWKADEEE